MKNGSTTSPAQRGREFWLEQLRACEAAALTIQAYAKSKGLNAHTAYTWRRRLRAEGVFENTDARRWARVQIEPSAPRSVRYRVELPNGWAIELGGGFEEAELARLLRMVGER